MSKQTAVANAVRLGLFALVSASVSGVALAQSAASQGADVERIEVTGSRIKRTDMENASPVVVIGAADIEKGGFNSVQDVLDNLSQNSGGSMTQQEVHGFTPAASSVNLRGVGAGRVLTLINGKRVPKYPFGAGGTSSFVDTANIPMGAIERVEILTTGASAIYGSDAMGGVINIILKKNVEETTFKYRFSDTHDGGLQNNQFSLMTGASSETTNLTFFLEYEDREALKASDRLEWGTDMIAGARYAGYSSYGVNLSTLDGKSLVDTLTPEQCTARGFVWLGEKAGCGFDRAAQRDFMPEQKRYSTMINLTKEIGDNHEWYSRLDYTHSTSYTEIESGTLDDDLVFKVHGDKVTVSDAGGFGLSQTYDKSVGFGGDFANATDGEYKYKRRLLEVGPRTSEFETNNFAFVTGLTGYLTEDIEYDTSWSIARQEVNAYYGGSPTYHGMFNYVTSGKNGVSLLDKISAEDAQMLNFIGNKRGQSTLSTFNFGINGELPFELPGGAIGYATGVEYSLERFYDKSDAMSTQGAVIGKGGSSASGDRGQYAGYVEAALPVIDDLTVTLAGRYDYYDDESDVGGQFSPQVAVEYRPINSLLIRALYAETFRAPDMQRLFGQPTRAYSSVIDPVTQEQIDSVNVLVGPNPHLEAESGSNYNIGLVYEYEGLNLSVDYWMVDIDNMVSSPSAQYILNHENVYGDKVVRDAEGNIVLINTQAMNMSSNKTAGIDFSVGYSFETGYGDFSSTLNGTYLTKWERKLTPDSEALDLLDGEDSAPKLKANLNLGWGLDNFSTNLLVVYTDKMNGVNMDYFIEKGWDSEYSVTVDRHVEVNWTASYFINDAVKLSGGINNLFDAQPELDATDNSWPHYPRSYYNVVGREYYAGIEVTF
ncbi:TonB-dependent receptor plug domain-containing protein [Shewanella sp. GXUN23E]|uniref:TonB-dependent receptor plug domain-containing protein n=1 Tax=Shewanella sp. GXUN23E TaxID=3422498 RepID=UPI003D7EE8D4